MSSGSTVPAWLPLVTAALTLATAAIGYGVKWISDSALDRRHDKRDARLRAEDRLIREKERAADFQRSTLIELQDVGSSLARAAGAIHHQDGVAFRATGEWQKQKVTEEFNQELNVQHRRLITLCSRILDAGLRQQAESFVAKCVKVVYSRNPGESATAFGESIEIFTAVQQRAGEIIRSIDVAGLTEGGRTVEEPRL